MFDFLDLDEYDLFGAFWMTVQLTVVSAIGSLIWGTILVAMRVSPVPIMRAFGTVYVNVVRNTPLTLVIVACAQVLAYQLNMTMWADFATDTLAFRMAVLGLVLYTSTFVCEALRSGINTVPVGQAEAARALGLNFTQVLFLVVLPQAFRSAVGPLTNVLIALTKNTTIASAIGVAEAAALMKTMIENEAQLIPILSLFALGFILLTLPTGLLLGWVGKRVAVKR